MRRMDDMEKAAKKRDDAHRHEDDDVNSESEEERKRREEEGRAKEVVADSTAPQTRYALLGAQAAAEKAYEVWGLHAPAPLYGERLRDYRIRLLRPLQKHSKQFSKSDLDLLPRDEAIFGATESAIYTNSVAASSAPDSVPRGQLRMVTKRLASGHTVNEFIGEPQAWMDRFAANRRYVTRINSKWQGAPTE